MDMCPECKIRLVFEQNTHGQLRVTCPICGLVTFGRELNGVFRRLLPLPI